MREGIRDRPGAVDLLHRHHGHAGICLGRHSGRALRLAVTGLSPLLAEWGWIDGKTLFQGAATAMDNITFWNFTLPVLTIALYGIGYIARMTRASHDRGDDRSNTSAPRG